jgi:NAD(P)-dependent dehydrogenase (short-subunit alcohol dehydrogenase family)
VKSVLITGTSTGIGRACAERMAAEGWTVYAGVRSDGDADAVRRAVAGDVRPVLLDVTSPEHIEAVVALLTEELGDRGLDALVNNAGVSDAGPIEAVTDEEWRRHFDVNVFGVINLTRATLPLLRTGQGRVVNVGSVAGRVAIAMLGTYAAGKHAIEAFSESLRFEVEGFGMKVACVEPGEIKTAIWGKAEDQMAAVKERYPAEVLDRYDRHVLVMEGFLVDGARRGVPARWVASAVHHALTSSRPKHRYLVGPDAKLIGVASRLPDRARQRLIRVNLAYWAWLGRRRRARA